MTIRAYPTKRIIETIEGGLARYMTNKIGADSVKGSVIKICCTNEDSVILCPTGDDCPSGIIYDNGVADGDLVLVVYAGIAEILVDNSTAVVCGYWAGTSDTTAGRAKVLSAPPAPPADGRNQELGFFIESKNAGTDILAKTIIHFR